LPCPQQRHAGIECPASMLQNTAKHYSQDNATPKGSHKQVISGCCIGCGSDAEDLVCTELTLAITTCSYEDAITIRLRICSPVQLCMCFHLWKCGQHASSLRCINDYASHPTLLLLLLVPGFASNSASTSLEALAPDSRTPPSLCLSVTSFVQGPSAASPEHLDALASRCSCNLDCQLS
jgi:hypothetical protein